MQTITLAAPATRTTEAFAEHPLPDGRLARAYHWSVDAARLEGQRENCRIAVGLGLAVYGGVPELAQVVPGPGLALVFGAGVGGYACLDDRVRDQPSRIRAHARELARQHRAIHALEAPEGQAGQKDLLRAKILRTRALEAPERHGLLTLLDRLPGGRQLCHGDLDFAHVHLPGTGTVGPVRVDRWQDMTRGDPWGDVGRTYLLLTSALRDSGARAWLARAYLAHARRLYLRHYAPRGAPRERLHAWVVVNAGARLCEDVSTREFLASYVRRELPRALRTHPAGAGVPATPATP